MDYDPRVISSRRTGRRTYVLGPGGAPVIGYRPALLVADTPLMGRASKIGRLIHKVIRGNLGRLWIWPQCHYGTVKKRFGFFKTRYHREFIQLYEVDHTLLGMLTRSSWEVLRQAVCHSLKPSEHRRRPDINSPDPNSVRGAIRQADRVRRLKQRKRRKIRRRGRQFRDPMTDLLFQAVNPVPEQGTSRHLEDEVARDLRRVMVPEYVLPVPIPIPPPAPPAPPPPAPPVVSRRAGKDFHLESRLGIHSFGENVATQPRPLGHICDHTTREEMLACPYRLKPPKRKLIEGTTLEEYAKRIRDQQDPG